MDHALIGAVRGLYHFPQLEGRKGRRRPLGSQRFLNLCHQLVSQRQGQIGPVRRLEIALRLHARVKGDDIARLGRCHQRRGLVRRRQHRADHKGRHGGEQRQAQDPELVPEQNGDIRSQIDLVIQDALLTAQPRRSHAEPALGPAGNPVE